MNKLEPSNQQKIIGLDYHMLELVKLYKSNIYPNKLLISGPKGVGKSTLAYHFINFVLSESETFKYDLENFQINSESPTFKTILNKSNTNLITIDINLDKKSIEINQIRELIICLNKSSFNDKPRFVLIDNIELLNINSINALLKVLEEPNKNIHFILINSNHKILPTLLSRCINYKVNLTNQESINISSKLLGDKLENIVNIDLINYYFTPGNIYCLVKFAEKYNFDLSNLDLKSFLKVLIKENYYKKDQSIKYIIFHLIEFFFRKLNVSFSRKVNNKFSHFLKRTFETSTFNLDEELLFSEFQEEFLNE